MLNAMFAENKHEDIKNVINALLSKDCPDWLTPKNINITNVGECEEIGYDMYATVINASAEINGLKISQDIITTVFDKMHGDYNEPSYLEERWQLIELCEHDENKFNKIISIILTMKYIESILHGYDRCYMRSNYDYHINGYDID